MGAVISHYGGYAPRVHFSSSPLYIPIKKSIGSTERKSLRSLVESKCPTLFSDFYPAWWLFNGHLQTIYCVLGDFSKTDKVVYNRTYLRLLDGGTLGLDFTPVDKGMAKDDAPIIVVLHGLTGGSHESYVRAILAPACAPVEQGGLGYRGVVVNFRGCAGTPVTSPQLYSAGHTDDIRQAVMYLNNLYPNAQIIGLGFSLGANIMVRYVAEEGESCRLAAACILACPWDLAKNNDALNSSVIGRAIYSKGMGGNLLALVKKHIAPLAEDPSHRVARMLPEALALKNPTLDKFDDTFTRVAGGSSPPFPFDSAQDYYHWASSHHAIADVKIPFLAINAADDPVVQEVPMHAGNNPWTVMALTAGGGHLGWFESSGLGEVKRWISKPVLEWLRLVVEEFAIKESSAPKLYIDEDGFLKEVGNSDLGSKEIEGGGLINGTEGEGGILQGL